MNTDTKEDENKNPEEEKYKSFLQIIATISFVTLLIEGVKFLFMLYRQLDSVKVSFSIMSIVMLLIISVLGLVFANGYDLRIDFVDTIITKCRKRNDRAVTFLFFLFLLATVLYIIQDGGAKNSSITNILLISANLGFFFAKKRRIKYIALISCLLGYLICNIIGYNIEDGFYFSWPDFSVVITTCISIIFNSIINANVTWFIQNNVSAPKKQEGKEEQKKEEQKEQ